MRGGEETGDGRRATAKGYRALMRRLLKFVFSFFLVGTAMWAGGQLLSRNFEGDPDPAADEFRGGATVSGAPVAADPPPPEDLPPDAPVLTVEATVRSGGVMIEAGELQQA